MQKSKFDHSVFYRNSNSGIIMLVVYVDDMSFLESQFHTKDLGMLRYFLGFAVMRSKHEIFLS